MDRGMSSYNLIYVEKGLWDEIKPATMGLNLGPTPRHN